MKTFRCLTHAAVVLACCGILMPQAAMAAPQAGKHTNDLALSANGGLSGVIVTTEGHVLDGALVNIRQGGKEITNATTDEKGRFMVNGLTNGIYEVGVGNKVVQVRTWSAEIAPPTAHKQAVIVVGNTKRGQDGEYCPPEYSGGGVLGLDIITLTTLTAAIGAVVLTAINQSDLNDIQDQLAKKPNSP